jgi:peptide chain release factor 2
MDYFAKKNELKSLKEDLKCAYDGIKPDVLRNKVAELEAEQNADGFWNDVQNAQKVSKEISQIKAKLERFEKLLGDIDDAIEIVDIVELEASEEEDNALQKTVERLGGMVEKLTLETLLSGKYDGLNAILTLHAGAGGTEAQDWCDMLYRMYSRYVERTGWKLVELDYLAGDEAGIKSVTFRVEGDNAYGYLKAEKGVHRLVRISPFDSQARRHTSFASLEVMPEIIDTDEIEIRPEDLKVDTYRSSGAGGQHVNKTESAIRITHLPTGIIVACQNERSQIQNREVAMQMLRSKLIEKKEREREEEAAAISGKLKKIEWGSQIRSYVFCPYTMVKDHRTAYETGNVQGVMDGDLDGFIDEYLKLSIAE